MVQTFDAQTLADLSTAIFVAAGATPENADGVTRSLIGANRPYQATPFGGKSKALGTNPFSWAVPRPDGQPPILLDYATTGGAQGKLMVARARKEPVPEGWILDSAGNPTTNVEEFYAGG